jgi:membrane protease YdiL (CAAX protease family)
LTDEQNPPPSQPPPARFASDAVSQPPPPTGPPLSVPSGPPPGGEPKIEAALPQGGWTAGRAFGGLGFLVGTAIVIAVVVSIFDPDIDSLAAEVALQALLAASLILTAFLFASSDLRSLVSPEALGLRTPVRRAVGLSVITYLGYIACAFVIAIVFAPEQEDITRELGGDSGTLGTVIAGFLIIIVAPLSEEIFFRGFLFAGLRRSMRVAVAAVLASAIWGLFHYTGPGTWGVVLQITVFGLWLSWLYGRTGSIYPTIAVHVVNNAIAFTFLISS